jgi:DNA invertase Pin-like site-specific DNA recombinase
VNPKATKPKRAVGYVRRSVKKDDETSTESQEQAIRAFCDKPGWSVVDVKVDKGRSAYSASRNTRPEFKEAMELIRSGAANALVVWRLDRLSRSAKDTLTLVDELAGYGAELVSVSEGELDPNKPTGKLLLTMLSGLAEMESHIKRERTIAWQDQRRAKGLVPTGPRPFGYLRERNRLIIEPAEAAVIRKAADAVLAGQTIESVLRDLAGAGVVGRSGKPFAHRTLHGILTGPTIAACREVQKEQKATMTSPAVPAVYIDSTEWEPILDRQMWEAVRAVLKDPARRISSSNARRWLLPGIARCGRKECQESESNGRMRSTAHSKSGRRYSCMKCGLSIHAAQTDAHIEGLLLGLLNKKAWRALRRGQAVGANGSAGLSEALAELTERYEAGDIDSAEWATLADALKREAATAPPPPSLPDVDDLAKAWPKLTLEQRRLVVSAATESLTIMPSTGKWGFDDTRIKWVSVGA